jgi:uncharacterized delta-60 repeat protein
MFGAAAASASSVGFLNPSFATGGNFVHTFGLGSSPLTLGGGIAVAPNGDIYQVGGASTTTSPFVLYIARFLPNGTLDPSFGNDGVAYASLSGSLATAMPGISPGTSSYVALTASGDPVVLTDALSGIGGSEAVVFEFNTSGQLNDSFGSAGTYALTVGASGTFPGGVAVTSSGDIAVAGTFLNNSVSQQMFATELTGAGTPVSSFGTGGLFEPTLSAIGSSAEGVVAQSNGDLVFSAAAPNPGATTVIFRSSSSGQLDTSFGSAGFVSVPEPLGMGVGVPGLATTPDGGYAVTSATTLPGATGMQAGVTRLTSGGQLDTSFGTGGTAPAALPTSTLSIADGVVAQADGKLVVTGVGVTPAGAGPFVARVNADGTLDASFGAGGVTINPVTAGATPAGLPVAAAETPDGNIVLSGSIQTSAPLSFLQEVSLDVPPVLATAADASSVPAGTPVHFVAAAVSPAGESLGQVSWDLGSGKFGDASGTSASKTFPTPGTYTVHAEVTDALGLSASSTQTVTVTAASAAATTTTPTVAPAQALAPTLKLVSLSTSHGKAKVTFLCAFAACTVNATLTTHAHMRKGKTASLSAGGGGKSVTVASTKLSIGVNQIRTFTIKLNKAGRKLLAKFGKVPATGRFKLTNATPAKTVSHKVTVL